MSAPVPVISVVVPTYQRPDLLERCLAALLKQTLARDAYEIIVCDDGPSRAAQDLAEAANQRTEGRPQVRYFPVTRTQGPAGARNVGWQAARAELIAFTDDDTVPEPAWLEAGVQAMASGVEAAAGRIVMPLPERATDYERDAARLGEAEFATANVFVRRSALASVGGFDERYTQAWREDSDLHFSLLERGYTIVPAPGAVVIHPLRSARFAASISSQKKVMYDVLLYRNHPRLYRERIRRTPPWFYTVVTATLLAGVCSVLAGWQSLGFASLLVWAVLTLFFFFRRLRLSAFTLRNVGELLVSSLVIPPLSLFWRVVGARRFGLAFP
ncbi:MAG: glycosyltransferase [Candidimonas sp.]|nr:glycosyltransferase [Candidimonas sp.]